jgi:catechol 2,3-dioxygenase-like lactoylglutathione lyase family enzyme
MKIIPLLKCRNMKQALGFYTGILDFELKGTGSAVDPVVDLVNGDIEMQLTILETDSLFGSVVNIRVDDVDGLFKKYLERGLDISWKEGSPVHQGPVDQSWGMREFYVTDSDGNTLRFNCPFNMPRAIYLHAWPYKEGRRMDLPVHNVGKAAPFYTNVFNFREVSRSGVPVLSVVFERDNIQVAIAENGGDPSQEGCFFEVDNVETAFKELQLNGLKKDISEIGTHKHGETNWMVFYVVAPDGLCYCIGEKQASDI